MRRTLRAALAVSTITVALLALAHAPQSQAADVPYDVLVFSKTSGFRHDSIPAGIQAIRDLGAANQFTVTATEDANAFTTANLAQYEVVIWLSTTGDVLNDTQQAAFQSYIGTGKGYVGVHSAADTEYGWSFYGSLVGAYFASHPAIQQASINVESRATAATAHLGPTWTRTDEWYNYQTNPRSSARVLASLNESSYSGGSMGGDHPISWCKTFGGGRSFYTGLGHTQESYTEANFRSHLLGGIRYAAGMTKIDCRPETGYTSLYSGSTSGWSQAGPGSFTNSNATLTSVGGLGMLWYSAREFGSYSLKLDWTMPGDDNSGIFVGFPSSSDPNLAINNGYEIQIDATDAADRTTGAIYGFQSANIAARDGALNPPGEWNTYEILVEGERLRVYLNGTLINDFTNTVPARSLVQGYIGIQNHGTGDDVSFRNIRIRELGTPPPPPPPPPGTRIEAESFTSQFGTQNVADGNATGGVRVGYIDNNDWLGFSGVNVSGRTGITARVASGGQGGQIQVRSGSQTGPILGTVNVTNTGGYGTFVDVSASISSGSGALFLVFTGTGTGGLFDVDNFALTGGNPPPPPPPPGPLSMNVHLFYYSWYGNPATFGQYRHWQQGGHTPPNGIGANLYPTLGAYDSGDYAGAVAQHMQWVRQSGAGVIVYSWWGQGSYEDNLTMGVLNAAQAAGIKVAWHLEPYSGRSGPSTVADINYINNRYGSHPAYYRSAQHNNRGAFYVFESLNVADWSALSQVTGSNIVLAQTTDTSRIAGFSGMYTYDAIAGNTAPGWANASAYARANNLIWAPSIGPGYIDDRAVPGNTTPTLPRNNGATYDNGWNNALNTATGGLPTWVSITSFNEWHEGSIIEPARSSPPAGFGYETYNGAYGRTGASAETAYLDRTAFWAAEFERRRGGATDTSPPSVPGNLRVTGTTANSISLAWNASTDNVGVSGYDVFRENGAADVLVGSPTGTTFTVGSLAANTSYQFYVVAKDAAGNRSGASNTVTGSTTGTPPTTNLALNRPATASSSCNANEGPAKAVNGTVNGGNTDKWCALGATKWWQVDLGSSMTVGRFVVRHAGAGGENAAWNTRDFDIQVSTNGTTWTTVSSPRGNTANVSTHTIGATSVRYVRLNVLVPTSNTDTAARIYEFEVYAS